MKQPRHRYLSLLFVTTSWLVACEPPPLEPSSDSHTNWLRVCSSDRDCAGLSCECGVCTLPCTSDQECGPAPGASCVAGEDAATVALCGGVPAPSSGLCLPTCQGDAECVVGQACVAGACQPLSAPGTRVAVDGSVVLGSLTGFGAAVGYAEDELAVASRDPVQEQALFAELGLDVLRLRNRYGDVGPSGLSAAGEVVAAAARSLGHTPLLMLSSWSPPAELKQNGMTFCRGETTSCTLRTLPDGQFDYAGFAGYWRDSLEAYAGAGVRPDYIGIQNNPDWVPPAGSLFEACKLLPSEGTLEVPFGDSTVMARYPGYDRAFEAVEQAIAGLPERPRIAAPELSGTRGTEAYLQRLDVTRIHAIAHHFYGEDPERVDLRSLEALKELERTTALPLFQSEMQADGYGTALLIHHALVTEGASMYLQTALAGPRSGPLANPLALLGLEDGQVVPQDPYFAMRHYARFTDAGFKRVEASSNAPDVLPSAWLSPDEQTLVVVLINASPVPHVVGLDLVASEHRLTEVVRTVFGGAERFVSLGAGELAHGLPLPAHAIATLRYTR